MTKLLLTANTFRNKTSTKKKLCHIRDPLGHEPNFQSAHEKRKGLALKFVDKCPQRWTILYGFCHKVLFFFFYENRAKIKKCFFFKNYDFRSIFLQKFCFLYLIFVRFSQQFPPKICFFCLIFVKISPKFFPCGAFA